MPVEYEEITVGLYYLPTYQVALEPFFLVGLD
jgi:hypothetical protein